MPDKLRRSRRRRDETSNFDCVLVGSCYGNLGAAAPRAHAFSSLCSGRFSDLLVRELELWIHIKYHENNLIYYYYIQMIKSHTVKITGKVIFLYIIYKYV